MAIRQIKKPPLGTVQAVQEVAQKIKKILRTLPLDSAMSEDDLDRVAVQIVKASAEYFGLW